MPFKEGNHWGHGRPPKTLRRPELLLPMVLATQGIQWAREFGYLYRKLRDDKLTAAEKTRFKLLERLMPYLCTPIKLKEVDPNGVPATSAEQSVEMAQQAQRLLKELENDPK